jgi:glycosyltransferase involved in cell wall biosynthesis
MTTATTTIKPSVIVEQSLRGLRRLAIATINRPEGDTGVHTHTRMLCEGLREAGGQCDVVSAFGRSRKWMPLFALRPLLLHRMNKSWSTLWHRHWHRAALRENLVRYVSEHKPDAILAQCPVSARAALDMRAQLRGDFSVAMVCHFNHSEASEYRDKGELSGRRRYDEMLRFEDSVLSEVDRVIYVSHWARDSVEQSRGLRTRSSAVIWNGVNDVPATTSPTRKELGVADDAIVLINVGSLEPRKNQLGLLPLFAEINAQHPSTRLVLIGDGPQRDEIERKIAQLELSGVVRLLGHRRDVPAILPLADLYVHYASLENCPLALIESARAGVPFAAVPAGGVPELQTALGCRIDLTPHDLRQSLDNLRPLLENGERRRQQGQIARERFVATFTHQAMTCAYLEALSTIR